MSALWPSPAARTRRWSARVRHGVTILAIAALLAACEGGSGQSGSAFVFLTVDGFSLTPGERTSATVNSSIDTGTTTTACVTLRNNLKNPTITGPNALDNVIIQSYTVTLTPASGGALPGPFTFGTAVLVPAGTGGEQRSRRQHGDLPGHPGPGGGEARPPRATAEPAPDLATAEVTFRGRDGRGNSVETEGAVTVVFTPAETGLCGRTALARRATANGRTG